MPTVKSAAKRVRQTVKRNERNRAARSIFRGVLKRAGQALADGDAGKAAEPVKAAIKVIGLTEKKGLIHRNKAARHASRLTKKYNALLASKSD